MDNSLQVFTNDELKASLRMLSINGAPWFVGIDVATALGYVNPFDAIKKHVDDEDKQVFSGKELAEMASVSKTSETLVFEVTSPRGYLFINESGLYSLILSSKLPQAKSFKRWVTAEILPSIRKNGSYSIAEPKVTVANFDDPKVALGNSREQLFNQALDCLENLSRRFQNICSCEREAAFAMAVNVTSQLYQFDLHFLLDHKSQSPNSCTCNDSSDGTLNATELGRYFGCSAVEMNKRLEREGYVTKDATGDWIPTKIGAPFAKLTPCTKTRRGYYIRWNSSIILNLEPEEVNI